MIAFRPF